MKWPKKMTSMPVNCPIYPSTIKSFKSIRKKTTCNDPWTVCQPSCRPATLIWISKWTTCRKHAIRQASENRRLATSWKLCTITCWTSQIGLPELSTTLVKYQLTAHSTHIVWRTLRLLRPSIKTLSDKSFLNWILVLLTKYLLFLCRILKLFFVYFYI